MAATDDKDQVLYSILNELKQLSLKQSALEQKLERFATQQAASSPALLPAPPISQIPSLAAMSSPLVLPSSSASPPGPAALAGPASSPPFVRSDETPLSPSLVAQKDAAAKGYSQRVVLTTYPGQVGINPIPLTWGAPTPEARGPVVVSRQPKTIKVRNAIGAHAGSYSIYGALAAACGLVDPYHKPDYTNTEPPVPILHNPAWDDPMRIVSFDPYGHLVQQVFKPFLDAGIDVRPTIAITKAHIKLPDIDEAVRAGRLKVDGKIVVETPTDWINKNKQQQAKTARSEDDPANQKASYAYDAGVELNVSKAAIEPVWYLPGLAQRLNISEGTLRRALFEQTGGMYPELLTRHDLKVFLPPIGGMTVYIFGDPALLRDEKTEIVFRPHDQCSGSDVFGSDICTCRPYLLYGIEEAVKCAQRGGVGIIVYFTKEGRALGETTKFLVYNKRKRTGDNATLYFDHTKSVAGVTDMRFQALMSDVLHWLGIKRIDAMVSMSDMKYDAVVASGIEVKNRYEIPEELVPPDSQVELAAKISHGYYSTTQVLDLSATSGRLWEDLDH